MFVSVILLLQKSLEITSKGGCTVGVEPLCNKRHPCCVGHLAVSRSSLSCFAPGRDSLTSSCICRELFPSSLGNSHFFSSGVEQKMGDTWFNLSWGGQVLQGLSMRCLLWLELVSLQLYLQKDEFNSSHRIAWIRKETVHC